MSAPFALWIRHAFEPPRARSGTVLEGVALGRCPEPGQALRYWAPLCPQIPLHFSGLASAPRGVESSAIAITVREPIDSASRLVGGLVVESGVQVWPLAASLREDCPGTEIAAARVAFTGEHCWGLVRRRRKWISLALIGGPVWTENPWNTLESIRVEGGMSWTRQSLAPVMFGNQPLGFVFSVLHRFERGEAGDGLVCDPTGVIPISRGPVRVMANGLPFQASVLQQENGLSQFLLDGKSGSVETVSLPAAA